MTRSEEAAVIRRVADWLDKQYWLDKTLEPGLHSVEHKMLNDLADNIESGTVTMMTENIGRRILESAKEAVE